MKFATKEFSANGTAALALIIALIKHMQEAGTLIPKDIADIAAAAAKLVPQGVGRMDSEARDLIASLTAR